MSDHSPVGDRIRARAKARPGAEFRFTLDGSDPAA